ncbi:MAG: DUF6754 domain-containing protein [Anaerolineaceae bacterium]|nr:DUF6754 domain-containing protein [Anaerolineaceae bacterium]
MPLLTMNDLLALLIVLIAALILALVTLFARSSSRIDMRLPASAMAVDSLLQRSAESGGRILMNFGSGFAQSAELSSLVGLNLQRVILRRSFNADQPAMAGVGEGSLALLSQQLSYTLYTNALIPEGPHAENTGLSGLGPMGNLAGLLNSVPEAKNAGMIMHGSFCPEGLLALDLASQFALETISAASDITAQAAFWPMASHSALGEDYFASVFSDRPARSVTAVLKAADWLRILFCIGLLAAAILKVMGEF